MSKIFIKIKTTITLKKNTGSMKLDKKQEKNSSS